MYFAALLDPPLDCKVNWCFLLLLFEIEHMVGICQFNRDREFLKIWSALAKLKIEIALVSGPEWNIQGRKLTYVFMVYHNMRIYAILRVSNYIIQYVLSWKDKNVKLNENVNNIPRKDSSIIRLLIYIKLWFNIMMW